MWSELHDSRMYPEGLVCHSNKTENMNSVQSWHFTRWQIFHFLQFLGKVYEKLSQNSSWQVGNGLCCASHFCSFYEQNSTVNSVRLGDGPAELAFIPSNDVV